MEDLFVLDELIKKYFSLSDGDKCLCGSGKDFGKCHKLNDSYTHLYLGSLNRDLFKKSKQRLCFNSSEQCSGIIAKSHSIPRQSLVHIATTDGHVLRFVSPEYPQAIELYDNMQIFPVLVGINEVGTFNGFCTFHDDEVFKPLEKVAYSADMKQNALLLYRAICKELFVKRDTLKMIDAIKKVLESETPRPKVGPFCNIFGKKDNLYKHLLNVYNIQFLIGTYKNLSELTNDYENIKDIINNESYHKLSSLTIMLEGTIEVNCCSYVNPLFDDSGNIFQDYNDLSKDCISFSMNAISNRDYSYINYTWISNEKMNSFFDQVIHKDNLLVPCPISFGIHFGN